VLQGAGHAGIVVDLDDETHRGAVSLTFVTHTLMRFITSSHSPSTLMNMALVSFAGQAQEDRHPAWPSPCHDKAMRVKRFGARIAADPRGHAVIAVPFDPDEAWGAKARHHVNGTVNGCRVRVTIAPGDSGWAFTLNPARMRDTGIAVGSEVIVELAPEGPQRGDLAGDISAALEANPAAAAFFDTLAQFYRRIYLRYIDATTRRPDLRAARIAEVVSLLADGIKERPRS
jgi:hypothetical protein